MHADTRQRLATAWWIWLALVGIWPFAHPAHTTPMDPMTWIDMMLHAAGIMGVVSATIRWARQ